MKYDIAPKIITVKELKKRLHNLDDDLPILLDSEDEEIVRYFETREEWSILKLIMDNYQGPALRIPIS